LIFRLAFSSLAWQNRMAPSPQIIVHIDGASRGNPGPAAYGVVVESADGSRLAEFSGYLGKTTNNVAEYQGLLAALDHALSNHYPRVKVQTDSELMELQIKGVYKVKNPGLKPLHEQARRLIARLESFSIEHVPRERNREADRLANLALDAAEGSVRGSSRTAPATQAGGQVPGAQNAARAPERKAVKPLRTSATFHDGVLEPHFQLSLVEGEVVDLEIYQKE
jgi:ribonuclease HI